MSVPPNTPNLASSSKATFSPNERLAMNKDTVKPIPPNKLIPVRLLHVIPEEREDNRSLMANQVKR